MAAVAFETDVLFTSPPIDPRREAGAYEALWTSAATSFKTLAKIFERCPSKTPAELVDDSIIDAILPRLEERLRRAGVDDDYKVCLNHTLDYPQRLRDATYPIELFYYRGALDLAESTRSVAVVGTRAPSDEGARRTRRLVRALVQHDFTVFSGLARGVDTIAHETAMREGGRTVAVLGTPITECYPAENRDLQERIAHNFLVLSQVPILKYSTQTASLNRLFFPERNATMSALSDATIIVEAGETSGTLVQARAALRQGRKLFILDNCFNNPALTWPEKYERRGAIRVRDFDDILIHLARPSPTN